MGTWGTGTLDNDDSWDWLNEWHEEAHLNNLTNTLEDAAGLVDEEYLELPECGSAIAAAEVVAAWNKQPNPELPDEIKTWVASQPGPVPAGLLELALRAVQRIRTSSEMQEGWAESEEGAAWKSAMTDLQARLTPQPQSP